jgi:hypothetical protein
VVEEALRIGAFDVVDLLLKGGLTRPRSRPDLVAVAEID